MAHLTKQELQHLKEENSELVGFVNTKGDSLIKCDLCSAVIRVKDTRDSLCVSCKPLKNLMGRYSNPSHPLTEAEKKRILDKNLRSGARYFGKVK